MTTELHWNASRTRVRTTNRMPQPQVSEDVAKQMGHFFGVPGVPNDVFKNGFNNRLNDGIHPTRLPYNGAGSYSSTGKR